MPSQSVTDFLRFYDSGRLNSSTGTTYGSGEALAKHQCTTFKRLLTTVLHLFRCASFSAVQQSYFRQQFFPYSLPWQRAAKKSSRDDSLRSGPPDTCPARASFATGQLNCWPWTAKSFQLKPILSSGSATSEISIPAISQIPSACFARHLQDGPELKVCWSGCAWLTAICSRVWPQMTSA